MLMPTQASQIWQGLVPKLIAPAAATISHARFAFDVAFQLWLREQVVKASALANSAVENDFIVWGMTDSSPQGGQTTNRFTIVALSCAQKISLICILVF